MNGYDEAAHHVQMLDAEKEVDRVIEEAQKHAISAEDAALLRWASGIRQDNQRRAA